MSHVQKAFRALVQHESISLCLDRRFFFEFCVIFRQSKQDKVKKKEKARKLAALSFQVDENDDEGEEEEEGDWGCNSIFSCTHSITHGSAFDFHILP